MGQLIVATTKRKGFFSFKAKDFPKVKNLVELPSSYYSKFHKCLLCSLFDLIFFYKKLSKEERECVYFDNSKNIPHEIFMFFARQNLNERVKKASDEWLDVQTVRDPYHHQKVGIALLQANPYFALFDEQGTGKTLQVVEALENQTLIICPKNVSWNWAEEIELSNKSYELIQGTKDKRLELYKSDEQFLITSFEALRNDISKIRKYYHNIVVDEAHRIKNKRSKTIRAIRKLKSDKKFLLGGTPISRYVIDLWPMLDWLTKGQFGSSLRFMNRYCVVQRKHIYHKVWSKDKKTNKKIKVLKKSKISVILGPRHLEELQEKLKWISIRRLKKDCLDLPEKIINTRYIELNQAQQSLHDEIRDKHLEDLRSKSKIHISNELTRSLRLMQVITDPNLLNININSSKLDFLDTLVKDFIEDKKIIIWTVFVDVVAKLYKKYKEYNPVTLNSKTKKPKDSQDKFQNDNSCKMIIANPGAGGIGINLTAGGVSIYLDRDFNWINWSQSQDRFHRPGTKDDVYVICMVVANTMDEYIHEKLKERGRLSESVLSSTIWSKPPNKDDLIEMLTYKHKGS